MDVPLALPAYEATLKAAHTFNMLTRAASA